MCEQTVNIAEKDPVRGDFLAALRTVPAVFAAAGLDELVVECRQLADNRVVLAVVDAREHLDDVGESSIVPDRSDTEEGRDGRERIALGIASRLFETCSELLELGT